MKQPALRPEDGATFHGGVTLIEQRLFRAHCYARLAEGDHISQEAADYEMFKTADEGFAWIADRAARRGFEHYMYEMKPSAIASDCG